MANKDQEKPIAKSEKKSEQKVEVPKYVPPKLKKFEKLEKLIVSGE